jgi:hypothetical protein
MDLCFTWRVFYSGFTVSIWGYGDWATMSYKTTARKGRGIGSGRVIRSSMEEKSAVVCLRYT